jgi:superfamily II DNA or RNA helicase
MITKICSYGPRSDFIVKILQDIFQMSEEEGGGGGGGDKIQVMVLAHNRSLLTYLHDAIAHRGFASAGYYVGGMKELELKKTEEKQIVLATYAMAAEALDIKTLSILVMATPKTDIEQSVGRILREKHANPMVVDIIDKHDTFQNQWRKRKTFYRKNNYKILQVNSNQYKGMIQSPWVDVNQKKQREKPGRGVSNEEEELDSIKGCMLKWY